MSKLNIASGSKVTFDSVIYPVTNLTYNVTHDNTDTTDSSTAVGFKESIDGRKESTFTFNAFKDGTASDIPTGETKACTLHFGTHRYIGSASIQDLGIDGDVVTGVVNVSYSGKFHGAVSASIG